MDWKPDRKAKKAIYKQLADHLEKGIANGTYPPDKPLPSERKLAHELEVNRSTVVAAYDELEAMGLIERRRGSGTTISKDIWGMTKQRIPSWNRYIEAGSFLANEPMMQRIRKEMVSDKLINLASGELSEDLFPIHSFAQITGTRCFSGSLGYDHPQGNEVLRRTIANHVQKYRGIETDPSAILITSGAQQALHLVAQCLLRQGDAIALEEPSYHYSLPVFKSAGIRTFYLPVDKNGIDPDGLLSLHKKHRIRMIFLNPAFQNPTGAFLHHERRRKILKISSQLGIPVVEDDPYSLTSFTNIDPKPLKSMDQNGNVLYISSLSKIVASGLRIGWIIGPKAVIERLADAKQQVDFGHASFTQWVANDFLESDYFDVHIKKLVARLEERRNVITASLHHYLQGKVEFDIPQGGIHLWCKINDGQFNETQLLEESIKRGVIYAPGSTMGRNGGYVRFTYARENKEKINEGIRRFSEAIKALE